MGALGRVLSVSQSGAFDDGWYPAGNGQMSTAGVAVGQDRALTLPAFYAGVTTIAETVGTTPFDMYERVAVHGRSAKRSADHHPVDEVIHSHPNTLQSAVDYWEWKVAIALLRGRSVSEILPGPRGAVDQLIPLHPDLVTPRQQNGRAVYAYRDPKKGLQERILTLEEVFVLRGRLGTGVLDYARDNIGITLAMQRHQGLLFSRGARHQGVISHQGKLSTDARGVLSKEIDKFTIAGPSSGRPMLLEDGMTWANAGFSDRESQLDALLKLSVRDAARWLRIQPHKLADLGDANFSNIEHLGIEFVTDTIRPWCVRIEQAVLRDLILRPERFFAEFNLEGLLRGDTASRYAAYEIAIRMRWMTRNEVRAKENMNPIAGGDVFDEFMTSGGTTPNQAAVAGYLRLMARDQAKRAVAKETAVIGKLAERTGGKGQAWADGVREFYAEHGDFVAKLLRLEPDTAAKYAQAQGVRLMVSGHLDDEIDRAEDLTALALAKVAELQVTPASVAA